MRVFPLDGFSARSGAALALAGLSVYGVLQVLAYRNVGIAGFVASRAWIVLGAVAFFFSARVIVRAFRADLAARNLPAVFAFGLLFTFTFAQIGSYGWSPNGEGFAEIAGVFEAGRTEKPDLGWAGFSHFDQPHRMFFVNALPTLVWGRHVESARLGFLLPAIFGLCLLYAALRAWDEDVPGFRYVALLAVVAIPTFPILTLYLRQGEQAINPVSLAILVSAWFLICLKDPRPAHLTALAFFAALTSTCYAPGLLVWVLFLVMGFGILSRALVRGDAAAAGAWALTLVLPILDGATCLLFRKDLGGLGGGNRALLTQGKTLLANAWKTAETVLFQKNVYQDLAFLSLPLLGPILLYLVASLLLRNGPGHFVVAGWVVGCVAIGTSFTGYNRFAPEASLHRVMAVLPVMVAGLALATMSLLRVSAVRPRAAWFPVPFLILVAYGAAAHRQSHVSWHDGYAVPSTRMVARVVETVRKSGIDPKGAFVIAAFGGQSDPVNFYWGDAFNYLFPKHQGTPDPARCLTNVDTSLPAIVLVRKDGGFCEDQLRAYAGRELSRTEFDHRLGPEENVRMVEYVFRRAEGRRSPP
jgi:hypothetical protein